MCDVLFAVSYWRQFRDGFCAVELSTPAAVKLYAAVGMARFFAGEGYKTQLAAWCFVAEATGGKRLYSTSVLIGAAVAYAISGEASVSGDQRLHEGIRSRRTNNVPGIRRSCRGNLFSVQGSSTLRDFADNVSAGGKSTRYISSRSR